MPTTANDQTGPSWEQFRSKHNWGYQGNENRQEVKLAKKKRPNNKQK
jgi:hypothetical protein